MYASGSQKAKENQRCQRCSQGGEVAFQVVQFGLAMCENGSGVELNCYQKILGFIFLNKMPALTCRRENTGQVKGF